MYTFISKKSNRIEIEYHLHSKLKKVIEYEWENNETILNYCDLKIELWNLITNFDY
jgi:hypothetical protein